ncbi:sugar phosphate isomerase/epimerase family protein [Sphingomonas sp.]|uniref:sugar phosphate isomerase/epimerase family protein n=1 Tax=Sphingomonas sp. TaxID=28214 RepID=UPI003B0065AD
MPPDLLASYFTLAGNTVPVEDDRPSPTPFRDRVEAASRAGFTGFGLYYVDLVQVVERYGYAEMRAILASNGIKHLELDALQNWFTRGELRSQSDATRRLLLESAAQLGAYQIKAVGDFTHSSTVGEMSEAFDELCGEALAVGTRVGLEPCVSSNIETVDQAMQVVESAGHANGGLVLDIWHIVRGGTSYNEVRALPGERIFSVELNDGSAVPVGPKLEDTIRRRLFCGEGSFDVPAFIAAVQATGYRGYYGVELVSDVFRAMPLDVMAKRAFSTSIRQFPNGDRSD